MLIDSHCHIHDVDYPLPAESVLKLAAESGVGGVVTMSGAMADLASALEFATKYHQVYGVTTYAFLGVHPHEASNLPKNYLATIRQLAIEHKAVVRGIGEIGLDYYYDLVSHQLQIKTLKEQLELAHELALPVSMHIRSGKGGDAFCDLKQILQALPFAVRGVVHSYTDNLANLEWVLDYGLYVGLNGIATFNRDPELMQVYAKMPLSRIVLETDAPYLAPKPYRGKPNQPSYIAQTANWLANQRHLSIERVADQTTQNVRRVYNIEF